ncbi:hypothetical protein BFW01_g1781 [Lasiodiplodia theobromae]|uniref:Oxidoreductase n=1 Tax=Lasiodiplodia theobromae TaxID=45133 RepID=A0A8H7ITS5_9PEZI|nr:hypothetical protein BFW01_g1781 [Lasiodiplodia theobromae]
MATPANSSTEPFPVLFIGGGNITFGNDNVHWNHSLRIERYLGSRLDVVGIVDPSEDRVIKVLAQKRTSSAASCYLRTQRFDGLDEAAATLKANGVSPKLIILAVPPHLRGTLEPGHNLEEQVIKAFGKSPAIFCEKPVSTARPHEVVAVVELLERSGNVISVGYMLRYLKVVQKAMSIIRENDLMVMAVNARYTVAYSKMRKFDWWDKSKQCGPIVEQATHFCDLCRYLGGEVAMDSVRALALEHSEPPGKLSHMSAEIDDSRVPEHERIPRATMAMWKFRSGAIGSLAHIIALHGTRYSNEIVVTADGYQLRLVDLYTTPTLYVRTPLSEKEEVFAYQDDDPFYSEFAALFDSIESEPRDVDVGRTAGSTDPAATPGRILSTYGDAHKTYEFTWRIRDESERPSGSR